MEINWPLLIIILAVCMVAALRLALARRSRQPPRYQLNTPLLSPAERSFYGALQQAAGADAIVLVKVRVADVLSPEAGLRGSARQTAFNRISAKHFDFVICDAATIAPRLAVELDDASHRGQKQMARDRFLDDACRTANFQLVRVVAQRAYVVAEIRERLRPAVDRSNASG